MMSDPDYLADFLDYAFGKEAWERDRRNRLEASPVVRPAKEAGLELTAEFWALFPALSYLVSGAGVVPLTLRGGTCRLLGWRMREDDELGVGRTCGWLCQWGERELGWEDLHPHHVALLRCFGGICQYWNPVGFLMNQNPVFLASAVKPGFDGWESDLASACAQEGRSMPLVPEDYLTFAFEANGNRTAYHRVSGEVVMFAAEDPDPGCSGLVVYPGAPEKTLYRLEGCATFRDWVERLAREYLEVVVA